MGVTREQLASQSVYRSLSGLLLLGVWLVAAEDVLLGGVLSSGLSDGFGFHIASFAAYTTVFLLAALRRGLLSVWGSGRSVVFGTYLVTVVLGLLVLGRGLQLTMGLPLTGLDAILGEMNTPSYSSFPTLFFLWLLHVADAHCPKRQKGPVAWASYALFSLILMLTLHQISDMIARRDHEYLLTGVSVLSVGLLLSFAAFILPEAPATALLFDRRAPKSNAASAGNLLVVLAVLFLLEYFVPYSGVALGLAVVMLVGLPLLVTTFRPLEIDARLMRGELVEDEDANEEDLSADAGLTSRPEEAHAAAEPEGLLERAIYWATFEASNWQRLAIQGFWTFALAYGAILLSRQADDAIATIWWANGYLAYCLLLHPKHQWFKPLLTFYAAVLLANLLAGNALMPSTILTVVNTLEGAVLAVAAIAILQVKLRGRYVTAPRLSISRILIGIANLLCVSLLFGLLGGTLVTDLFGGSLGLNIYAWGSGAMMGAFAVTVFGLGKLMALHWGYKHLSPTLAAYPYLAVCYLLLVVGLYAFLPPPASIAAPHVLFMLLSIPLVFLPSLLQAGSLLLIASALYFHFSTERWAIEAIPFQFPFVIALVSSLVTISIVARNLLARERGDVQQALKLAPNALLTFDRLGRVLSISKNAVEWFERSPEELIGKRLVTFFDNSEELQAIARDGFVQGTATAFTAIARRTKADGSVLHLETSTHANSDPFLPYASVVSLRDITREVALEAEKKALIDRSTSRLLVQDEQWNTLQCSDAWVEFTGYSREETLTKDFHEFLHPEDRERGKKEREALLRGEASADDQTTPYRLITKAGEEKIIQLRTLQQIEEGQLRILLTIVDITELESKRKELEALLVERDRLAMAATAYLDAGTTLFFVRDKDYNLLYMSEKLLELFEYSSIDDVPSSREWRAEQEAVGAARKQYENAEVGPIHQLPDLVRLRTATGREITVKEYFRWFPSPTGDEALLMTSYEDVTELEERRRYTETLLNRNSSIILTQDRDWKILSCSNAWTDQLGYSREETLGRDLIEFMPPTSAEESRHYREQVLQVFSDGTIQKNTLQLLTKSGKLRTMELQSVVEVINGDWRNILTLVDITEIMRTQEQLTALVERDTLTGLYSRRGMQRQFIERERKKDTGLFIVDADHFKSVNDSYGHEAGDALLMAFAETLKQLTEKSGCAIRLGGEEFAIVRPWAGWDEAYAFGEGLREALKATQIVIDGRQISRTASIGIAELRKDADFSEVMKLADLMQREAKQTGRNRVVGADEKTLQQLRERGLFITNEDVQAGLENGEFFFALQPIWNTQDKVIEGFEALIRWQKPDGSMVMPTQFIDVFSVVTREPRYNAIKAQLRKEAIAKLGDFPKAYISFNYSLEQIATEGAAAVIDAELSLARDHPDRQLVIELSESAMHGRMDSGILLKELEALKERGYLIALDDFGVESSNIKRLQDYPIDIVKLDRSLVAGMEQNAKQRATITALAIMLQNLKLKTIVEGVETVRQANTLNIYRLFSQQGYVHARPMRPEDVAPNLASIGADLRKPEPLSEEQMKSLRSLSGGRVRINWTTPKASDPPETTREPIDDPAEPKGKLKQ